MTVTLAVADGVARLTIDRPDAFNAIDLATAQSLLDATIAIGVDPTVRVVLLSGAGRAFCGGGDVKAFATRLVNEPAAPDGLPAFIKATTAPLHAAIANLARLDAPVVAAVHGSAAGAGFSLMLQADVVLVAEGTKLTLAYTGIGLTPDGSVTWFLPRIVGVRRAAELMLTNRVLSAQEAVDLGIATRVVPADDLVAEADALVAQLATGPTRAYGAVKRLLLASSTNPLETQMELEARSISAMGATADGREGVTAFVEKRPPTFTGH
jgi:2-(1,2-epoxy-1,2-dihydrophenyl)acetyl-CoA isomerase